MAVKVFLLAFSAILGQVWCKEARAIICPSFSVYLPHETQPFSYFACSDGEATLLKCDLNRLFDTRSQKCVSERPSSISSLDRNRCALSPHDNEILPHENDCNLYYSCQSGEKVLQNCPADLNFGFEEQVCAWTAPGCIGSRDGHIGVRQTPDDPADLTDFGDYTNGCPRNHHIHRRLPHEYNCQKFYYCVHGRRSVARICSSILVFDKELQVCVWPWDTECSNRNDVSSEKTGSNEASPGPGLGTGSGPVHEELAIRPDVCPKDYDGAYHLPYPYDCGSFYTCGHGEKTVEKCFNGLHFDFNRQACVWPWETNCDAGSDGGSSSEGSVEQPGAGPGPDNGDADNTGDNETDGTIGGSSGESKPVASSGETNENGCPVDHDVTYLQPHEDCSKFYSCVYGGKVVQYCPAGLFFKHKLQACVWSWLSGCVGSTGGSDSEPENSDGDNSDEDGTGGSSEETVQGAGLGETNENGCPVNHDVTYLQPHEDCSKFYSCVYGEKVVQYCPAGLLFKYKLQACVWPWESDCEGSTGGGGSKPDNGDEDNSDEDGTGGSSEETVQGAGLGETNENGCPVNHDVTYLQPHEDCSKFYSCVYGEKVVQYCPAGLLFKYKLQACVWPWESDCEGGTGGGGPEPDNSDEDDSDENETGGSSEETVQGAGLGETNENGCPVDHDVTYLQPHEDCSKFYSCVYGEKVVQYCPAGLLFKYKLQACVWPWESDCVASTGGVDSESDNGDGDNSDVDGAGGSYKVTSPGLGPAETNETGCPVDHDMTYLQPHEDCSKFYSCVYGEKVVQYCPAGLLFKYKLQACVWPWESDCVGTGGSSDFDETDSSELAETQETPVNSEEKLSSSTESGSGGGNNKECPAIVDGLYLIPHETDCSLFYACDGGERIQQNCYLGLKFSYEQQGCVWPWASECFTAQLVAG